MAKARMQTAQIAAQIANQEPRTPGDVVDVCELFLAELQSRRERLRQLLQMVTIEVNRASSLGMTAGLTKKGQATKRARCKGVAARSK